MSDITFIITISEAQGVQAPQGWVTPTEGQVTTYSIATPTTAGWTIGAWVDLTDQAYTSYAIGASMGATETERTTASLDRGAIGMKPGGEPYALPLNTNAARNPTYLIDQGPVHLAIRYEYISGTDYTVTPFINGVPMYNQSDSVTPDANFLQTGETTASGRIKAPDRFANTFYEPSPLTNAQISSRYLSERAALAVDAPKMLVIGSFDSLTAFSAAPFWGLSRDASLRPGVHFMLDAMGGSKHGGGGDLGGTGNNYNSPERQGLRRRVLANAAAHYDKVIWLCQYGTNDLVNGPMTPGAGAWTTGRDTIDGMIFGDIATVPLANRSKIQATIVTIPPHGGWIAPGASTLNQDREVARLEYNQDCRDNFASRGYGAVLDWATHIPAGFADLEAAAIDAITNGDNGIYLGDGIHWSQVGSDAAAADLLVPYFAAELAALNAESAPELTAVYEPTASSTTVGMPLQFTGNLDVDWGDGTTETLTGSGWKEHTYATASSYTAKFSGAITQVWDSASAAGRLNELTAVTSWGDSAITRISLSTAVRLTGVPNNLPSTVTSLNEGFKGCVVFNDPNILQWNVDAVTNYTEAFRGCWLFNQPFAASWNMTAATNVQRMLGDCPDFNQSLAGMNWVNVTDASDFLHMVTGALDGKTPAFNSALPTAASSSLTTIQYFMNGCVSFAQATLGGLDVSGCASIQGLISNTAYAGSVASLNIGATTTSFGSFMAGMPNHTGAGIASINFSGATTLQGAWQDSPLINFDVTGLDFSNVTNAGSAWAGCEAFTGTGMETQTFAALTAAHGMFDGCGALNCAFTAVTAVLTGSAGTMFRGCTSLNTSLAMFDFSACTSMAQFLNGATAFAGALPVNYPACTNMGSMLANTALNGADLSNWCVSNIPSEPAAFASNVTLAAAPVWGTCPAP